MLLVVWRLCIDVKAKEMGSKLDVHCTEEEAGNAGALPLSVCQKTGLGMLLPWLKKIEGVSQLWDQC